MINEMVVKEEKISEEMNQEKTNSSKMLPHRDQMNRPKKYFCEICEKSYCQLASLEMHVIIQHLRVKVFKCDLCEKSFYHYLALIDHIKLYHQKAKMSHHMHNREIEIKALI